MNANIQRISRHQLQLSSLEDKTTADNPYTYSDELLSKFITFVTRYNL